MRIPVRTSRLAIMSRRMVSFALPLMIIPIFLHRSRTIDSETFGLIVAIGMGFAALGLISGLAAMVRLWFTGDMGWGRAATGVLVGLLCLLPVGLAGQFALRYPQLNDVTTSDAGRILLINKTAQPPVTPVQQADILAAFPNLIPRDYVLTTNQAYRMAMTLVQKRGWEVVDTKMPELENAVGQINATEMTYLGWTDEVAIHIERSVEGAEVSMRSASLGYTEHDLGRNGRRIEAFLRDLDEMVTDELRRGVPFEVPAAPIER